MNLTDRFAIQRNMTQSPSRRCDATPFAMTETMPGMSLLAARPYAFPAPSSQCLFKPPQEQPP
jgi:hypothetical protein